MPAVVEKPHTALTYRIQHCGAESCLSTAASPARRIHAQGEEDKDWTSLMCIDD